MLRYIVKRFLLAVVTLLFITAITFVLMHEVPGGPFQQDRVLVPEIKAALDAKYNLDEPLYKQFITYVSGLLRGDMGPSFKYRGVKVEDLVSTGFPISARFGLLGALAIILIGMPLGVYAALKHNKWQDRLIIAVCTTGAVIPAFVLAIILMYTFGVWLDWLPVFGINTWQAYILPVSMIAITSVVGTARLTRASMLDVFQQDYVRTARAKGLSETRVVVVHVLRNSLIPVVTSLGMMIAAMLTGSFIVERMFAIPGLGRYFIDTIANRDYMAILSMTIITAAIMVVAVFLIDILYTFLDPRIRLDK